MRPAARMLAASCVASVSLLACSLLVDTSGLSDGAATTDATIETTAADASDAPVSPNDGTTSDVVSDVVGDASVEACATGHFCDDFDEADAGSQWSRSDISRGVIAFDGVGLSLPNALRAEVVPGGAVSGNALLEKGTPNDRDLRCELDLKLVDIPSTGEVDILDFVTGGTGGKGYHVYFAVFDGVWSVAEYQERPDSGALDNTKPLGVGALPMNSWFHVVLDMDGTNATLEANGATATLAIAKIPGTSRTIDLGITYSTPSIPTAKVFVDNLDCAIK